MASLPRVLARLSGETRVPQNAVLPALCAVVVLDLLSLCLLRNGLESFTWWANALVFFATLTFLAVNVANTCFFWRLARERFRLIENLPVPLLGVVLNAYLIYAAFISTLWAGEWRTGKSVVLVCVALLVAQLSMVAYLRVRRQWLFEQPAPITVSIGDNAASRSGGVVACCFSQGVSHRRNSSILFAVSSPPGSLLSVRQAACTPLEIVSSVDTSIAAFRMSSDVRSL